MNRKTDSKEVECLLFIQQFFAYMDDRRQTLHCFTHKLFSIVKIDVCSNYYSSSY